MTSLVISTAANSFQAGIAPVTETEAPLFHPRQQEWAEHFAWSADTTQIVGITATGRATVALGKSYLILRMHRGRLLYHKNAKLQCIVF